MKVKHAPPRRHRKLGELVLETVRNGVEDITPPAADAQNGNNHEVCMCVCMCM